MDSENGMNFSMPVAPTMGYGMANGNNGFGFGGDWAWILLLLVLFGNNGWGNGFGGGFGGDGLYPWMNSSNQVNNGFRDQMLGTQINGIQSAITSGFGDVQNALCGGFAGVTASVVGAQNALAQQLYANQMAQMQQDFAMQSQFSNCCCENRAGLADLKYTIASEACADRAAAAANTQRILDQMCADKIDAKNDEIAQLRTQINVLNLAASQNAQTAAIIANNEAQTTALEKYLAPNPVPAYVVQNPNCCGATYGCGCGA